MTNRDELESMCKRRGFLWQSAEIYGGEAGFYDYGHLGAELLDNWKREWKKFFLGLSEDYHLIYTPNIHPYRVLESSGHVDQFSDVMIRCDRCGSSFRGDHVIEAETGEDAEWMDKDEIGDKIQESALSCPDCGGSFAQPEDFNMMFEVALGPTGERSGFLRPETAQGVYLNFRREFRALRKKMPMGLATIGSAFRNEISPRQGVYRLREFRQAELQIFFIPGIHEEVFENRFEEIKNMPVRIKRGDKTKEVLLGDIEDVPPFYLYHLGKMYEYHTDVMGFDPQRIRFRELSEEEKAFYNKIHFDLEFKFDTLGGWKEINGLHYRGDHDLKQHQKGSNTKLSVSTEEGRKIPHVIELSFGVDRNIWALLEDGYNSDDDRDWLDIPPKLAPRQVAVFPLVKKDGLLERSREVYEILDDEFRTHWEKTGSIGKRYARNDEVGTRYCVTIDYDTMDDDSVTIRDVESKKQIRVSIDEASGILKELIECEKRFDDHSNTEG